jgi:hypothetical protein
MEDEDIAQLTKRSEELIQRSKELVERSREVINSSSPLKELAGLLKAKHQNLAASLMLTPRSS